MQDTIPKTDPTYGHLTNRERRHVAALRRRAAHLQARIEAELARDLSYDKQEFSALTWALGMAANAGKVENGIPESQELA